MTQHFETHQLQKALWIGCAIGIAVCGSASAQTVAGPLLLSLALSETLRPLMSAHLSRRTI